MHSFFNKWNINVKLNVFLVLPILTLLFFSSLTIFEHYKKLERSDQVLQFSQAIEQLSFLIYNLQKERGLSAGGLSAHNTNYSYQLSRQRKITQAAYFPIAHFFSAPPKYLPVKTRLSLSKMQQKFNQLEQIRRDVDHFIDNSVFNFYSFLIADLLQEVNALHAMVSDREVSFRVSSFIYALELEESVAIERGLIYAALNTQLNSHDPTSNFLPLGVINHVARQEAELNRFYNLANAKHADLMLAVMNDDKIQQLHRFRESTINVIKQRNIFNTIISAFGFGGIIDDYKNYIIRGDKDSVTRLKASLTFLLEQIAAFKRQHPLDLEAQKYLRNFLDVIEQYELNIDKISQLKRQNIPVATIDARVKVDISPAVEAILKLKRTTHLMTPKLWWQLATHRLNLLHSVSSTIINDIITLEKVRNKQAKTPLIIYTFFVIAVLVISCFLSQLIKKRLVAQIKNIANSMRQSRVNKQSSQLLNIEGNDEIAEMSSEFNQLMMERSVSEEQLKLAAQVFVEAHDGIFITETNGTIIDVNPAFCQITGYDREEILGKNPKVLNSKKQDKQFYSDMWSCVLSHGYWKGEVWNRKKNGELYAELLTISSLKDSSGKTLHYMGLFADITQLKNQHSKLEQMAHYDALTLLPNRTLFIDRFNQAIIHANRSKSELAICFIDLDNFKPINDNYGHNVGDKILVEVAQRIKSNLRTGDTISRQGGDEFALLLSDIRNFEDCQDILQRIHSSLAKPFMLGDVYYNITASTGVTLYPHDQGDLDTLIRHADQAMYQIKLSGGDGFRLFNKEKDQQIINKQHKLNEIVNAIKEDEFILYYQPKVNMKTGKVFGVEALARWKSAAKGMISPIDFLPVMEGTNVEIQFGRWVISSAIKQLSQWQRNGLSIEVSINISSYHLQSVTFIDDLREVLSKYQDLDTRSIQLEILESSVLGDLKAIRNTLNICRELFGLQVALDDFGTGYSSLTHIKSLPANVIKIDQSFVIDMLKDANNYSIIYGVLGLANSFSRDVIAEGVESTAHGLMLLMMGCEKAQGYGIAKPMPACDFDSWLTLYQPNEDWLAWASETFDQKEAKLKVFDLALQHEFSALSQRIYSAKNQDINQTNTYQNTVCIGWLNRKKQTTLFCKKWLAELEKSYQLMYHYAEAIYQQQLSSQTDNIHSNQQRFKYYFDDVLMIMSNVP